MPLPRRRFIVLTAIAVSGLLALFLLRPRPASAPLGANPDSPDATTSSPPLAPPAAMTAAPSRPAPPAPRASPPSPATPLFPPSELLLRARAGSFTPQDVTAAVAAFAARTPEALAELDRLAASTDPTERLLGLYLRLELDGPTPTLLSTAAADPSPWVSSQAAEWLFFQNRFDLWSAYLQDLRSTWSPQKTSAVVALFSEQASGSPELPAGLVILQLGRGLPDLLGGLLQTAPEINASLTAALLDPATPAPARSALLAHFHEARPPDYPAVLEKLISAHDEDSPARFRAFVNYAAIADASAALLWLDNSAANATATDPLAFRFEQTKRLVAETAAASLQQTRTDTRAQVTAAVTTAPSLRALSETDQRAVSRYLENLRSVPPEKADAPALERLATLLQSEPHRDYSARRLTARVQYLAAQARG